MTQKLLLTKDQACALRLALLMARDSYRRAAELDGSGGGWRNICLADARECEELYDLVSNAEEITTHEGQDH